METKFKIIETEEYTLAVSDEEIKEGEGLIPNEWYINSYRGYDKPFKNHNLDSNGYLKRVFAYQPKNNAPTLDLPLLPEMVVEDDVELELKDFKSSNVLDILNMGNINYLSNGDIVYNPDLLFIKRNDRWFSKNKSETKKYSEEDVEKLACNLYGVEYSGFKDFINHNSLNRYLNEETYGKEKSDDFYSVLSFIDGYNKAAAKKFSEEDLIEFALWIRHNPYYKDKVVMSIQGCKELFYTHYIQSLKNTKTPKWFVAEAKSIYNKEAYEIEESKMELKTTSKNGKTYLVGTYLYE